MKTILLTLAASLGLLAFAPATRAYELKYTSTGTKVHWPFIEMTIHGASDIFTAGSDYRAAMDEVVDAWNLNPSAFRLYIEYDITAYEFGDSSSQLWFESDPDLLSGAPAVTYSWWDTASGHKTESDVLFDASEPWATSNTKTDSYAYSGNRSLQTVALHEIGHLLGLGHEADEYNIMGQDWDHVNANYNRLNFYPGEDACDGVVALYGLGTNAREDVSVVHWKYSGYSGEYSTHTRTKVYDSTGAALSYVTDSNLEPLYEVEAGQQVLLELTLENSGASTQEPLVKFYFSNNSLITTSDTVLDDRHPRIQRNQVYTITHTVTIPSTAESGATYYLGAVVDADNAITEINEQNNATYVGVQIK
jgi:hypothetical protein